MNFPISHTVSRRNDCVLDVAFALIPVYVWGVYAFGGRVITLALAAAVAALCADLGLKRITAGSDARPDPFSAVYALLSVCALPVSAPISLPIVSGAIVGLAMNLKYRSRLVLNPFVFSAAATHLLFPRLCSLYTRPFAYFSAFDFAVDSRLIEKYRVLSPLEYIADGSVFEDGVIPQLVGNAAGNIGEIAVSAMIISLVWLCIRKRADFVPTVLFLAPILILSLIFPSADAESEYFAYSILLSGAIVFISVFGVNESNTVPTTRLGRVIFSLVSGVAVFVLRKAAGGTEWSYLVILAMNLLTPYIEKITFPRPKGKVNQ